MPSLYSGPVSLHYAAAASWLLDPNAVHDARAAFTLIQPVEVWVGDWLHDEAGYYYFDERRRTHVVTLSHSLTWREASETCWHELKHAWQVEVLFRGDYAAFKQFHTEAWLEADARRAERRDYTHFSLTKRRTAWQRLTGFLQR